MIEKNNKVYVQWVEVDFFVDSIVEMYKDAHLSGVYGLPRGGLVFATMISNRLDIPLLQAPAKNCLIVDDIADSGRTLMHFTLNDTQTNIYKIATMFYDERSCVKPDYFQYTKEGRWIVFPWEVSYDEKHV